MKTTSKCGGVACAIGLCLGLLIASAASADAQITIKLKQKNGGTQMTAKGSATSQAGNADIVGLNDGVADDRAFRTNTLPAGWVILGGDQNRIGTPVGVPTLILTDGGANTHTINQFRYSTGPTQRERLMIRMDTNVQANTLYTASGSAFFNSPFNVLFNNYAPGSTIQAVPGLIHFVLAAPGGGAGPTGGVSRTPTILVTNFGAIASAESSLFWGHAMQSAGLNAADTVLRDLRGEIFTNGVLVGGEEALASNDTGSSSSLLRYFAFMQDENMSYKVALGLAEPVRRTIEVNMTDTLSAQLGGNINGQTLGGLPYAMMGVPLVGGTATVQVVEAAPSGKSVIEDAKAVVESDPMTRYRLFASGDFSFYNQDPLSDLIEGFDTDTYAGSLGIDYRINEWLKAGVAWSYAQSDTTASGNLGSLDLDGHMASAYATGYWKRNWFDLVYSYGSFNNDLERNTGLGSTARGNTDSDSHNIRLNMGHNIDVGNGIVTGPIAGFRYGTGDIDPFSERGGGSASMNYDGTDFESMVSRLGWQASHVRPTNWGRLISQVRLAWEHEYTPENGTVSGSLQTSPFALVTGSSIRSIGGYSTESEGEHPGTDWLSAGAGLRFELANGVSVQTDYEGVFFRSNATQHYAAAKVSYEWGALMPSGGGGMAAAASDDAQSYEPYAEADVADQGEPGMEADVAMEEKKRFSFSRLFKKTKRTEEGGYQPYPPAAPAIAAMPSEAGPATAVKAVPVKAKVVAEEASIGFKNWLQTSR